MQDSAVVSLHGDRRCRQGRWGELRGASLSPTGCKHMHAVPSTAAQPLIWPSKQLYSFSDSSYPCKDKGILAAVHTRAVPRSHTHPVLPGQAQVPVNQMVLVLLSRSCSCRWHWLCWAGPSPGIACRALYVAAPLLGSPMAQEQGMLASPCWAKELRAADVLKALWFPLCRPQFLGHS